MASTSELQNKIMNDIVGAAFEVYNEYNEGLLESAYEAAMKYVLTQKGHIVEQQVYLPMYYKNVLLEQHYRIDLVVDHQVIIKLKCLQHIGEPVRRQLRHYLHLTHMPCGMIINFFPTFVYTERWHYDITTQKSTQVMPTKIE